MSGEEAVPTRTSPAAPAAGPAALSDAEAHAHLEIFHQYLIKFNRTTEAAMFLLKLEANGNAIPENMLYEERHRIQEEIKEKKRKHEQQLLRQEEERQQRIKLEQERVKKEQRVLRILFQSSCDSSVWKHVFSYLNFQEKGLAGLEHGGDDIAGEIQLRRLCRLFSVALAFPKDRGWSVQSHGPWARKSLSCVLRSIYCFAGSYQMDTSKISKITLGEGVFRVDPPLNKSKHLVQFPYNICSSGITICGAGIGKSTIVGCIVLNRKGPPLYKEFYRKKILHRFQPAVVRFENLSLMNPRGNGVEICEHNMRSFYTWTEDNVFVPIPKHKLSVVFYNVEITNCAHDGIRINYLMDGDDLFQPSKDVNPKPRASFDSPYQQGLHKLLDIRSESGFTVEFVDSLIHHNGTWGINLQANHRILLNNTKIFFNYVGGVHVEGGKRILRFSPKQKAVVVGDVVVEVKVNEGEKDDVDGTNEEEFLTEQVDDKGRTDFYFLCQKGKTQKVDSYLKESQGIYIDERALYINHPQQDGRTPLFIACKNGYIDIVNLLLDVDSIDVNRADKRGLTPLFIACQNNHLSIVDRLLAVDNIDVNCACKDNGCSVGYTPLLSCFMHNDMNGDDNQELEESNLVQINALSRKTIFQHLLSHPNIEVNKALILYDKPGLTALMVASYLGDESAVKLLLRHPSIDISLLHEEKTARDWTGCGNTKEEIRWCGMSECSLCHYFSDEDTPTILLEGLKERRKQTEKLITMHEERNDLFVEDIQPGIVVVTGINSEIFKNGCLYEFESSDIVSSLIDNRSTTVGPNKEKSIRRDTTFGRVFEESISHLSPCGVRIVGNGTRVNVHLPKDHQIIHENNNIDLDVCDGGNIQYFTEFDPLLEKMKQERSAHVSKGFVVVPNDYWCLEDAVNAARQSNGQITEIFLSKGLFQVYGLYHTKKKKDAVEHDDKNDEKLGCGQYNNQDMVQQMTSFLRHMVNGHMIDVDFSLTITGKGKGQTCIQGGIHFHGTTKNDIITCAVKNVSICNPKCLLNKDDVPTGWKKKSEDSWRSSWSCPVCRESFSWKNGFMIHCRKEHPGHVFGKPEGTRNRVVNAWIGILRSCDGEWPLHRSELNADISGCCVNVSQFTNITLQRCEISNSQCGFICGQQLRAYIDEFKLPPRDKPLPQPRFIRALLEECYFHDMLVCENRGKYYYQESENPPNDPGAAITVTAGFIQINRCSIKNNNGNGIHIGGLCTKAILTNVVVQQNSTGLNVYNGGIAEIYGSCTDISENVIGVHASFDYSKGTYKNQYEEKKDFERPKYPSTVLMFLPPSLNVIHDNTMRHQNVRDDRRRSVIEGNYLRTTVDYENINKKYLPCRQCNILNLGNEAEREYKCIHDKIQAGKDQLRSESCDDPIVCWLAPNINNIVCPIHGKSMSEEQRQSTLVSSWCGSYCFDAMEFDVQESHANQGKFFYRERIPQLDNFLNKKFPPPPPPTESLFHYACMRNEQVAKKWPKKIYLSSKTMDNIFDVFATPDEIDALQREPPKEFLSETTEKTTKLVGGVLRTIKSIEQEHVQCFYCQRKVRKGGYSRTQWVRRKTKPPKCIECLEPCTLVRYLNPWVYSEGGDAGEEEEV